MRSPNSPASPASPASSLDEWDLHEIRVDFRNAAYAQNIDRLREILDAHSSPDILHRCDLGLALITSVRYGNLPIIELLLNHGVPINISVNILASRDENHNLLETLKLFRQHGWDTNSTATLDGGMTMNFMMKRPDAEEIIGWFLANGANANGIRSDIRAPIRAAASKAHNLAIPQLLLSHGATLKHTGALHGATARPDGDELALEMMTLLLDHGCDINEWEYEGKGPYAIPQYDLGRDQGTALHVAARKGFVDRARMLVAKGVDIGKRSEKGYTAKDWAQINGWEDVKEYLEAVMRERGMMVQDIQLKEWQRGECFSPGDMP